MFDVCKGLRVWHGLGVPVYKVWGRNTNGTLVSWESVIPVVVWPDHIWGLGSRLKVGNYGHKIFVIESMVTSHRIRRLIPPRYVDVYGYENLDRETDEVFVVVQNELMVTLSPPLSGDHIIKVYTGLKFEIEVLVTVSWWVICNHDGDHTHSDVRYRSRFFLGEPVFNGLSFFFFYSPPGYTENGDSWGHPKRGLHLWVYQPTTP